MAEQFNQAPDPLTSGASLREGAKYYFGTVSAIAGAIGVAGEIFNSSDRAETAFGVAVAFGAASALSTETFGLKNLIKAYANEASAALLALGTPGIAAIIGGISVINGNDATLGLIPLVAGEIAAVGSFIASRRQTLSK
jgi:hypothetical protein